MVVDSREAASGRGVVHLKYQVQRCLLRRRRRTFPSHLSRPLVHFRLRLAIRASPFKNKMPCGTAAKSF